MHDDRQYLGLPMLMASVTSAPGTCRVGMRQDEPVAGAG